MAKETARQPVELGCKRADKGDDAEGEANDVDRVELDSVREAQWREGARLTEPTVCGYGAWSVWLCGAESGPQGEARMEANRSADVLGCI